MLYTLYKWLPAWDLQSLDPACLQVEAFLRFAGVQLAVQECTAASTSPSGTMPALEHGTSIVEGPTDRDSFAAARAIIAYLKEHGEDLDRGLPPSLQGELLAFTALCETTLDPASLFTTWCEPESFNKHTRPAYASGLPFPLSMVLPWSQQRSIAARFKHTTREKVYDSAAEVFTAVAEHMRANPGRTPFFFGAQPCSLDALLFGHLAYFGRAPVAAPELRVALQRHPLLNEYVDRISDTYFSTPLPAPPPFSSREWADRAGAAADSSSSGRRHEGPKRADALQEALQRRGKVWLACTAAFLALYVLLSGQYFELAFIEEGMEDEDADFGEE